jgi:pimeloyl-ACP methyl ester carboxylesterase
MVETATEVKQVPSNFNYNAKRIQYKNGEIQTYTLGEGENVVFSLPSFPHSGLSYLLLTHEYDPAKYKFVTFDLPGWAGWSDQHVLNSNDSLLAEYVNIANAVIAYYQLERFAIIGYSFGTNLAIHLSSQHLDRLNALTIVSPVLFKDLNQRAIQGVLVRLLNQTKTYFILNAVVRNQVRRVLKVLSRHYSYTVLSEYLAMLNMINPRIMSMALKELMNDDVTAIVAGYPTDLPILVVASEDEQPLFRSNAARLRHLLKQHKTLYLTGDHDQFLISPKSEVVQKVIHFLTGSELKSPRDRK